MKIENLKRAQKLDDQLNKKVIPAIKKIEELLKKRKRNSDGSGYGEEGLYSLHVSEYSDGSAGIDLTGCCVGIEVLKFTKELLTTKKKEIEAEISLL
jgi:hypothetical protein